MQWLYGLVCFFQRTRECNADCGEKVYVPHHAANGLCDCWLVTCWPLTSWELEIVCHFHEEEIAAECTQNALRRVPQKLCVALRNGLLGNLGSSHWCECYLKHWCTSLNSNSTPNKVPCLTNTVQKMWPPDISLYLNEAEHLRKLSSLFEAKSLLSVVLNGPSAPLTGQAAEHLL